ncbi:MAG TPA: alpha/beta hydrolase [Sphingomonas sp.]|nr:alpha/beta hydrolase [Sphingomonas sp.]
MVDLVVASVLGLAAFLTQANSPAKPPAPSQPVCAPPNPSLPGAKTEIYAERSGRPLRIHIFTPASEAKDRPAALFFFGGGWSNGNAGQFQDQAKALRDLGFVAAVADYRVFCRDRTTPTDAVDDAQAAYRWIRSHAATLGIDPRRIVIGGGSAGGHLAAMTAIRESTASRPAALILFNPVVDLTLSAIRKSVRLDDATARSLSPALLPATSLPPTIIFHGTEDKIVPIESVRHWCDAIRAKDGNCRFEEYSGFGHGFFNRRASEPTLATSAFADTLAKAAIFLRNAGLTPNTSR